jgi:hypothetical protein
MVEERGSQRRDRRLEGKSRRVLLVCGAVLSSTRALARMLPHPSISCNLACTPANVGALDGHSHTDHSSAPLISTTHRLVVALSSLSCWSAAR